MGGATSAFASVAFYAVLAWKRNGVMAAFFLGSIANAVLSKVIKKLIAQTRLEELETSALRLIPSDSGMPSSHAMSLGFIGTFTLHLPIWWTDVPILLLTITSLAYRVQVKLHTWGQVAVGLTVGSGDAWLFRTFAESTAIEWLTQNHILNDQGLLPLQLMLVSAIVVVLIVGSV